MGIRMLVAGMPWTEDIKEFELPFCLQELNEFFPGRIKIIPDIGKDNYGKHTKDENFDVCLALHGNRGCDHMKERFEYLDSICDNVYCLHESYLKDYAIVDRNGYKGGHSLAISDEPFDTSNVSVRMSKIYVNYLYNKYVKPHIIGNRCISKPYILFTGQMPDDSSISCADNFGRLYVEMVIKALARLNKAGIPIIYKPHPLTQFEFGPSDWSSVQESTVRELIDSGSLRNVSICKEGVSIQDAINGSEAVVSICSGSAFDALLQKKPVVNLSKTDLKSVVHTIENYDDLINICDIIKKNPTDDEINTFIYAYVKKYLVPSDAPENIFPKLISLVKGE